MNLTDLELIDGCKRRSTLHEEYFFKKYYGFVMGIGRSYVKSEDLAQEITQDTFLKFFDTVGKLNEETLLKPWLRRIAVNTAIDYYRKNRKFRFQEEIEGHSLLQINENALDQLGYEEILKLLHQLPEDQSLVFNLYEVEGYSHKEIAEKLAITESSSRVYLTRAKQKLRQLIHLNYTVYAGR
ncbi:MAG: sigma-70 family RNA polymerase sigma factor [Algoriphagus sp.]|uniref:RNA polymerase sigma factor n=1 Tax=Algoriphagus sp. TaxID=1872435 RepID=UPI002758A4D5|nr:sigma-70 family RNA polymerase sigma factor [Algoriphagus sp.]MDP4838883.1 sigma-70 family RNA polymerase sigma factor [Algoriphagus sp.]MDP4905504.1 sigma-70 family RNA polymerase sigma factor [Algoriphagus sp.]MDP4957986.1 sigma-70 family RNA polymerase sigma factor [Algoriphagus sp.]MDP5124429.1 sigma-70 family RNA polymerase sigma factor [Algoriphagus sp.]